MQIRSRCCVFTLFHHVIVLDKVMLRRSTCGENFPGLQVLKSYNVVISEVSEQTPFFCGKICSLGVINAKSSHENGWV